MAKIFHFSFFNPSFLLNLTKMIESVSLTQGFFFNYQQEYGFKLK